MRYLIVSFLSLIIVTPAPLAAEAEQERLASSAEAMEEILNIPDALPQALLNKAECVVVMPSVKKFAIGFGGSYGRGALVCRTGSNFTGPWGAPAMYRLEGGSIGFQLGGEATDFLLLVMNPRGVDSLLRSKVTLGADATVAAGRKGVRPWLPRMLTCVPKSSRIPVRAGSLQVSYWKVPRCVRTPKPMKRSMDIRSRRAKSSGVAGAQVNVWSVYCKKRHQGIYLNPLR